MELGDKESKFDGWISMKFGRKQLHSIKEFSAPLTCDVIRDDDTPESVFVVMHCIEENIIHINKPEKRLL